MKNVLLLVCSDCGISDSIICHMELNDIIVNVFAENVPISLPKMFDSFANIYHKNNCSYYEVVKVSKGQNIIQQ